MAPAERGPTAKTATLSMLHHGEEDGEYVGQDRGNDLTFRRRGHKVIEHRMRNGRGVNDFSLVEGGRWKVGRELKFKSEVEERPWPFELTSTFHFNFNWCRGGLMLVGFTCLLVITAAAQETGWKADLAKMGFEVPVEELEKGEIVCAIVTGKQIGRAHV